MNGNAKHEDSKHDAVAVCKLLGIHNHRATLATLIPGLEKVNDGDHEVLTERGVRKLISTVESVDPKLLEELGHSTEVKFGKMTNNKNAERIKAAYSFDVATDYPVKDKTLDILIITPGCYIAIICDTARSASNHVPAQLTQNEQQMAFQIKAMTQKDVKWFVFNEYDKPETETIFTLFKAINTAAFKPNYEPPIIKTRKPRKKTTKKATKSRA